MKTKYVFSAVLASFTMVVLFAGYGIVPAAHANLSGNPHVTDPDDITKTNPQGKSVGNPHNTDEGQTHGNPHGVTN